ncbi:hypothetical protein [Chlamydia caviae]|uniref:Uncharacterized protein n=1 Tax=Chlamydia caviae (strain ATCC VR-813 / DSM 19441 / 03DC25 / GPIC) TaxID=227941 RepID=Q823M0_CHLCV|nr:hypothetical protein [Chlamydia caviae]AAP05136.1 conserved hypothetical protein [Chlamydia caviae GPIC]
MAFPLGNTRSSLGFREPQEETNVTESTSLVSTVAEIALTNSSTASTSQTASSASTLISSAFVSEAGDAAVTAAAVALSTLDASLEDIYVDMEPIRSDSASQTEKVSYLEYLIERETQGVVLRDHVREVMSYRSSSSGADLFARSSILTQPIRASMECLDDISICENTEETPLTAEENAVEDKSPIRAQLFSFFVDLLKQDLQHGNISGGRVKALLDHISGGMTAQEYKELLDLIKEGDFSSIRDISKLCNIFMSTPVFQSSHQLQALFAFFKGEGGAVTLVMLHELMGVLTETFGLPLPEGLGTFLLALKNLYETTHPEGGSGVAAAVSIVSLVSGMLQSETTRRVMQSCYDGCADSCTGNCGCTGCGCAEGAAGCGGFGSLLCGLFAGCFNLNTGRSGVTEEDFKKLEDKYSSAVVLIALNNLGVNTVDLLAGRSKVLITLDALKAECDSSSKDLNKIIKSKSREMWGEAACNYSQILSHPVLKEGIVVGLSNRNIVINEKRLQGKVLIDCSWGSQGFISTNEPFDSQRLVGSLVSLVVMKKEDKVHRRLGANDAAAVMTSVSRILSAAIAEGENIWLSTEDLMTLVCIVLAHRNFSVVDGEGSENTRIFKTQEIKDLFATVEENRIRLERTQQGDIRAGLNATVLYANIARNESKKETGYRVFKDKARTEVRNNLVTRMSMPWMRASGLVLKSASKADLDEVRHPIAESSLGVYMPQEYRETAV